MARTEENTLKTYLLDIKRYYENLESLSHNHKVINSLEELKFVKRVKIDSGVVVPRKIFRVARKNPNKGQGLARNLNPNPGGHSKSVNFGFTVVMK